MNCIVPNNNIKILSKTFHTLAKIGGELYIEAKKDYLQLGTINQNKTCYVAFNFENTFFSTYEVNNKENEPSESLSCILNIKAVLNIFKTKGPKDKNLDFCKIEFDSDPTKIIFKLKYKQDVTVVHSLKLIDMEVISVPHDKNKMANQINATGNFFGQVLTNFQISDEDMSFEVRNNKITIRNYDVVMNNVGKCIRSQVVLNQNEFTLYKISQENNITMAFKPFRAAIAFAETFRLPVTMHFDSEGKPVILSMQYPTFEVNFVLSTISPDGYTQSCTSTSVSAKAGNSLSKEDRTMIENLNWDSDFEVDNDDVLLRNNTENKDQNEQVPEVLQDDIIPESPESPRTKKIKLVFGRCFEATFHISKLDLGQELAPNSDSD